VNREERFVAGRAMSWRERLDRLNEWLERMQREHPVKFNLIAGLLGAALGLLVGKLLGRR